TVGGAAHIVAARNSKAAALGQFASALLPPRPRNYLIDALRQPIAQHAKAVPRPGRRLQQIPPPYFSRIELECRGNLVHLRLESETDVDRAVAAHGPARGLVGQHTIAV